MVIRKRRAILDAKGCADSVKEVEQVMSSEGLGSPVVAIDGQEVAVAFAVDHVVEKVCLKVEEAAVVEWLAVPLVLRWDYDGIIRWY